MSDYSQKVEILQLKANDLKEKIPFSVKFIPDVKAGMLLQDEAFRLMLEMAEEINKAIEHCNNCSAHDEYDLEKVFSNGKN